MTGRRQPGPEKRLSAEMLVEAGMRAVHQRFKSQQRLEDVLGVRLREITAKADQVYLEQHGERPDPPISSSTVYRQWGNKEAYLQDVFQAMFTPPADAAAIREALDRRDRPWQEVLGDWLDTDHDQAVSLGAIFLLAFLPASAGDQMAGDALRSVYDGFDLIIRPLLRQFLEDYDLVVTLPFDGADPDGVARLARMLTAITEGWYLRSIAQPEVGEPVAGRSPWAAQAVLTVQAATAPRT